MLRQGGYLWCVRNQLKSLGQVLSLLFESFFSPFRKTSVYFRGGIISFGKLQPLGK